MKTKLLWALTLSALLNLLPNVGFTQFSVESQLRNRIELRNGYQKLAAKNDTAALFISQRTRLGLIYNTSTLKIKIVPQDARVWGSEQLATTAGVNGNPASFDLYEGVGEIRIGEEHWLSIGRQELIYDNQILLGNANWNQRGIASDAVVLKLKVNTWEIHTATSWNTLDERHSNNYFPNDRFKTLNLLWAKQKFSDTLTLSLLHITAGQTENNRSNKIYWRHTTGFFTSLTLGDFSLIGNAYYQYGKNQSATTVNAFLGHVLATYAINPFKFGIGNTYLSGDRNLNNNTDNVFNPIYMARHQYFGFMDYFRTFDTHTNRGGIWDFYALAEWKPLKNIAIQNIGHLFNLAQTNHTTPDSRYLGYENDFLVNYKFSEWGRAELGYLMMLPTSALKQLQNVPENKFSQFIYVQLTLTPTLFKQKTPESTPQNP